MNIMRVLKKILSTLKEFFAPTESKEVLDLEKPSSPPPMRVRKLDQPKQEPSSESYTPIHKKKKRKFQSSDNPKTIKMRAKKKVVYKVD